jgi:hypothetical protein
MRRSLPRSREIAVLGACAVPCGHPRQRARLSELLADGHGLRWYQLVELAANENMAGLVWHHLQHASVPESVRTALLGLHLRQRALRPVQETVTARVLDVAADAGVDVMLLKGAALRRLVYPHAEMRAMRDIDLIAPVADGRRLYDALVAAGFEEIDPSTHPIHHPVLRWRESGFAVGVEIHWVVHGKWQARFDDLIVRAERVDVLGRPAWVPSRVDLLRHVFLHAFGSELWLGSKFVAVADLVAMLERWGETLDGPLSPADRAMVRSLAWLDLLAPLTDAARARVGPVGRSAGVGEFYRGWPLETGARPLRTWDHFTSTFAPSPWWLRLRARAGPGLVPLATAWARHVWNLAEIRW